MGLFGGRFHSEYMPHGDSCGWCKNLNIYDARGLKAYCRLKRAYYPINDSICNKRDYERDLSRSYDELEKFLTYHISTAICTILNIKNESIAFNSIKELRNIIENDESKKTLLSLYDVYGPRIVECMKNDPNSVLLCEELLTTYIAKTAISVKEGNIEEALQIYTEMVINLFNRYKNLGLYSNLINEINFQNSNIPVKMMTL